MLRFVSNFEFWSFEFVLDFHRKVSCGGFSASDLVAAEQSEAAPSSRRLMKWWFGPVHRWACGGFFWKNKVVDAAGAGYTTALFSGGVEVVS